MANTRGRGQTLNRAATADALGITPPTLDEWVRRGCPAVEKGGRGRAWKFNTAEVVKWREQDVREAAKGVEVTTAEELRRRKLEAETGLVELEFAKARGAVILVEEFERALAKGFGEVRTRLRSTLPSRVAGRIAALKNETEIKAVLREEIDEALDVLADADLIDEADLEIEENEE